MECPSKLLNKDFAKAKLFQVSNFFHEKIPFLSSFEIKQTKPNIILKADMKSFFDFQFFY